MTRAVFDLLSLLPFHPPFFIIVACNFTIRIFKLAIVILGSVTLFFVKTWWTSVLPLLHSSFLFIWNLSLSLILRNYLWGICVSHFHQKPTYSQVLVMHRLTMLTLRASSRFFLPTSNVDFRWLSPAFVKNILFLPVRGHIIVTGVGKVSLRLAIYLSRQLAIYTWCQMLLRLQTLKTDAISRWDVAKSSLLDCLATRPSRLLSHIPLNNVILDSWVNAFLRYRTPPSLSGFDEEYFRRNFHDASCDSITEVGASFLNDPAPDSLETAYTEDSEEPHKVDFTSSVALVPLSTIETPPLICADLALCSWASSATLSPSCKSLSSASIAIEPNALLERIEREDDDQDLYYDPLSLFDCTEPFMKDLHLDQCLGRGSFGTVFRGTGMDQRSYALKIMKQGSRVNLVIGLEVAALKRVSGNTQWATQLEYIQFTQDHVLLAMTYFPGGSLVDILEVCNGTIPLENAKFYIAQLILAIQSLHVLGVIHHDIKLDNVLLDAQGNVKLIDFGLAVTFDHSTVSEEKFPEFVALRKLGGDHFPLLWATRHNPHTLDDCFGTEGYAPPEVWKGEAHSYGVDYFGAACVYHWLITGTAPFEYDPDTDDFIKDKIYIYREEFGMSVDEYSFLSGALHERPHKRFTVSEMKSHPLFATIDWDALGRGELEPLALPIF